MYNVSVGAEIHGEEGSEGTNRNTLGYVISSTNLQSDCNMH